MNFLTLAKQRHSVRKYRKDPIGREKMDMILEAGRVAPTAANKQPQRFLVVSTPEGLEKLGKAANLHGAPCAVVVCALDDVAWKRPQDGHIMTDIDASIAADHIMLAAWEQGVASCWITWFDPAVLSREFALPANVVPVNILALGYADGDFKSPDRHDKERIPLAEMTWYEKMPG